MSEFSTATEAFPTKILLDDGTPLPRRKKMNLIGFTCADNAATGCTDVTAPVGAGVTDHGALTGLADNDHPQYARKAGETCTGTFTWSAGDVAVLAGTVTGDNLRSDSGDPNAVVTGALGDLYRDTATGDLYINDDGAMSWALLTAATPLELATTAPIAVGGAAAVGAGTKAMRDNAKLDLGVKGSNVASAATVNLDTATGDYIHITGTTTITAVTLASGLRREVTFDGVLTLTHSAGLILPTGANILTAVGDTAVFRGEGSSVTRCLFYMRADGSILSASSAILSWTFDTSSTAGADPGNQLCQFVGSATAADATSIVVDDLNAAGVAVGAIIQSYTSGKLWVHNEDWSKWHQYKFGPIADDSGFSTIRVVHTGKGTGTFADAETLFFEPDLTEDERAEYVGATDREEETSGTNLVPDFTALGPRPGDTVIMAAIAVTGANVTAPGSDGWGSPASVVFNTVATLRVWVKTWESTHDLTPAFTSTAGFSEYAGIGVVFRNTGALYHAASSTGVPPSATLNAYARSTIIVVGAAALNDSAATGMTDYNAITHRDGIKLFGVLESQGTLSEGNGTIEVGAIGYPGLGLAGASSVVATMGDGATNMAIVGLVFSPPF